MYININIVGDNHGGYTTEIKANGKNLDILDALSNAVVHICTELSGGFGVNMNNFTDILLTRTEEVFADESDS